MMIGIVVAEMGIGEAKVTISGGSRVGGAANMSQARGTLTGRVTATGPEKLIGAVGGMPSARAGVGPQAPVAVEA